MIRIPIWLVPIALGGYLYGAGEDPGMAGPFVLGPVLVAWVEGDAIRASFEMERDALREALADANQRDVWREP